MPTMMTLIMTGHQQPSYHGANDENANADDADNTNIDNDNTDAMMPTMLTPMSMPMMKN